MNLITNELIDYLIQNANEPGRRNLMLTMPLLGWSFGADNMHELERFKTELKGVDEPVTVLLREFTNIDSPITLKEGVHVPMKRIVSGVMLPELSVFLTSAETKESFNTCSETGKALEPQKDLFFVEPSDFFKGIIE